VVGRGSGGRQRHGLGSKSAWKNEKDFELKTIEPHLAQKSGGKQIENRSIADLVGNSRLKRLAMTGQRLESSVCPQIDNAWLCGRQTG
jgi:hypothetical protein